jgi:hypothetical protein
VVYLVPELELAERCPGGHRPFRPVPWTSWVPADARRVVWVLSGAPDDRFELPPGEDVLINPRFRIRVTEPPRPARASHSATRSDAIGSPYDLW